MGFNFQPQCYQSWLIIVVFITWETKNDSHDGNKSLQEQDMLHLIPIYIINSQEYCYIHYYLLTP